MQPVTLTLLEGTSISGLECQLHTLMSNDYDRYTSNVMTAHTFEEYCQKYWADVWNLHQALLMSEVN